MDDFQRIAAELSFGLHVIMGILKIKICKNNLLVAFVCLAGLLAFFFNLETIRIFPSWFDEAFFANISLNLAAGNGLTLDLIPGYWEGELNHYGPVYFYLQASLIDFFGLHQFIFRLPNLISAYISIYLISSALKQNGLTRNYQVLFLLAALVDVSFNRNLVGGRMDMLAVMFVSIALFLSSNQMAQLGRAKLLCWLTIGLLSAAAYLTTPRALFLLPVVFIVGTCSLFKHSENGMQRLSFFLLSAVAFTIPVFIWILYAGGFNEYSQAFLDKRVSGHLAPSFFRSSYDNVAIGLMLFLVVLNSKKIIKNPLLIGLLSTYVAFSLFVKEVGPYAAMIMPFVLAIIFLLIYDSNYNVLARVAMISILIFPGTLLLSLRGMDLYMNADCRNNEEISITIDRTIEANEKVVAPFKYYFLLRDKTKNIVTLQYSNVSQEEMIEKTALAIQDSRLENLFMTNGFEKVGRFTCQPFLVPLLPATFYRRSVFSEVVYKKII